MSMRTSVEPLSDHPLFRALVLMGEAWPLAAAGVAQPEPPLGADLSSSGYPSAGSPSSSAAGGLGGLGGSGSEGRYRIHRRRSDRGRGVATDCQCGPRADLQFELPLCAVGLRFGCQRLLFQLEEQGRSVRCRLLLQHFATHERCRFARQTKPSCAGEAYPPYLDAQPQPNTWDGTLHVQCACIPSPVPSVDQCDATCAQAFIGAAITNHCFLPGQLHVRQQRRVHRNLRRRAQARRHPMRLCRHRSEVAGSPGPLRR